MLRLLRGKVPLAPLVQPRTEQRARRDGPDTFELKIERDVRLRLADAIEHRKSSADEWIVANAREPNLCERRKARKRAAHALHLAVTGVVAFGRQKNRRAGALQVLEML